MSINDKPIFPGKQFGMSAQEQWEVDMRKKLEAELTESTYKYKERVYTITTTKAKYIDYLVQEERIKRARNVNNENDEQ